MGGLGVKIMYKIPKFSKTDININNCTQGESLEQKLERILENKEKMDSATPIIYTERKDGVIAAYNIRTDRWEIAIEATEKIAKSYLAKRDEKGKTPDNTGDQISEAEPIQTT